MTAHSTEQKGIISSPLQPMCVVACAGSGKTRTAVHRIIEMRRLLGDDRGRIALLSFSNVAVKTFSNAFNALIAGNRNIRRNGIEIDTMDGFITTNILRPHSYRSMRFNGTPYLLSGAESFLNNRDFRFWVHPPSGTAFPIQPHDLGKIVVNIRGGRPTFQFRIPGSLLPIPDGLTVCARLGTVGAYTHDLGRYWCYQTLKEQPKILKALARRYPHILIDESQDIGTLHQGILEILSNAGTQVSLIGDPHQGIYEFAGADGCYLSTYGQRPGVKSFGLTCNFRSVPVILKLANNLSARADTADRNAPETPHGAFFIGYRDGEQEKVLSAFQAATIAAGLSVLQSAVICRGRGQVEKLAGNSTAAGQGTVKGFAEAALHRDERSDYLSAFKAVAGSIAKLLVEPPGKLTQMTIAPSEPSDVRLLRREIWRFTRSPESGLPSATLLANSQWHPLLCERVKVLLTRIFDEFGFAPVENLGRKLAKTGLPGAPLLARTTPTAGQPPSVRIDTVHQVKGESLDAVLYIATKRHVEAMLDGVDTETGRIGYVAVTRARDLFWLAVPEEDLTDLRAPLLACGFREIAVG